MLEICVCKQQKPVEICRLSQSLATENALPNQLSCLQQGSTSQCDAAASCRKITPSESCRESWEETHPMRGLRPVKGCECIKAVDVVYCAIQPQAILRTMLTAVMFASRNAHYHDR
jgi:hypothetical protein